MNTNIKIATPGTKRIINQITKPYDAHSPYSTISHFDAEIVEYCQSLRATNNAKLDVRINKVIIIGDMGVGKTSIVQRFVKDHFDSNYKATIGVDFEIEQFKILSLPFNIQIWDTAGQERFRCIASAYYRGAHAIILTFSLIDAETLASTKRWLKDVLEVSKRNDSMPLIFLVGTKKDLLDSTSELNVQRAETEAVEFARQINAEYWPISSLTGQNVNEFFFRMTSVLFNRSINDELDQQYMKTLKRTIGGPGSDIKPTGTLDAKIFEKLENKCCV